MEGLSTPDAINAIMPQIVSVSYTNSSASSGRFSVSKPLPSVTGKTAIGVVGYSLSRLQTLMFHGIYVEGSYVYVDGYNTFNSAELFDGVVYVLYQ